MILFLIQLDAKIVHMIGLKAGLKHWHRREDTTLSLNFGLISGTISFIP